MKKAEIRSHTAALRGRMAAALACSLLVLAGCGEGNAQSEPNSAPSPNAALPTVQLQPLGGAPVLVSVEVVASPESRARGLMFRETLAEGSGMLFVFPETKPLSFWMRNTPLSLDILFLDAAGTIVKMHANTTPYSEEPLPSEQPARFVLEVPGGFAARVGVRTGDRVLLGALADTPAS